MDASTILGATNAAMTPASEGFKFERPETNKSFYWNCLVDGTQVQLGDILSLGAQRFVIAAMPPLLPIAAIMSNDLVTVSRTGSEISSGGVVTAPPSQTGGSVPYFGMRKQTGATETTLASGVPCALVALGARALAAKDGLPSSSPGPVRWKFLIGAGIIAKGVIKDRDILTDQFGNRHQVSQDYYAPLGYEIEAVRLES